MKSLLLPLVLTALAAGCVTTHRTSRPVAVSLDRDYADAPLADLLRVYDTKRGQEIDIPQLINQLRRADAVFLGETHTDEVTHRVELALLRLLADERPVMLGMEMLKRDQQPTVDDYLAGRVDEVAFREKADLWSNYQTGYRDLMELARTRSLPVIATNLPDSIRYKAYNGKEGLEKLTAEERTHFPRQLYPNSKDYWDRYARVVRGHMGHMRIAMSDEDRLYSIQSLWDNTMAFSCAQAREQRPTHLLLHVNGGFHTAYRDGLVAQFSKRRPQDLVATVDIATTHDLAGVAFSSDHPQADYIIIVEARARGLERGTHAVTIPLDLPYILDVPPGAAPKEGRPFVILMPPEGVPAADTLKTWRVVLGEDVIIAVVKHPYPHQEEALYVSGRWFWPEEFSSDLSRNLIGLERIDAYVRRYHYVNAARTAIVAQGSAATILAGVGLYSHGLSMPAFGHDPANYKELGNQGLPRPLPEGKQKQAGIRTLRLFLQEADQAWWRKEAAAYLPSGLVVEIDDSAERDALYSQVRRALGVSAQPVSKTDALKLLPPASCELGREWTERIAAVLAGKGVETTICTPEQVAGGAGEVQPLFFQGEALPALPQGCRVRELIAVPMLAKYIPLAPGDFGGTTVAVLPPELSAEAVKAWQVLEAEGVLNKRHRFSRLKIAVTGSAHDLPAVLEEIRSSHRSNVLIVPAVFCATAEHMRSLRDQAVPFHRQLTLHWQPGLGENLYRHFK